MSFQRELLSWIAEESNRLVNDKQPLAIPIHLLLVRMSLQNRDPSTMTASVELSLQVFDRVKLYRTLRDLYFEGMLQFVDPRGVELKLSNEKVEELGKGEGRDVKFVALTEKGIDKALS